MPNTWLTPTPQKEPRIWRLSSSAVLLFVSACSKFIFSLNKPKVYGKEAFKSFVAKRPQNKPLVTISNHYSMIDDFLVSYMLPWKQLMKRTSIRWLPGAKDVCTRTKSSTLFFQLGRVVPVVRGDGVYQYCMDFCVDRLNDGDWVHIYPEGLVNTTKEFMRLKWGVGRLIADSEMTPIVLPYWHVGMDNVFPTRIPYYPRMGKKVTVVIGEPIDFEEDLKRLREQKKTDEEIRKYITDKIQDVFESLKIETEKKHNETVDM
ncbi:tafazzin-like [Ruditapes philippinarum]|uniref:tafazzin-like n=1 Tax=Ruditapes philippinarum TaxID=129788 RepID=UPI00295A95F7|nr:tafazzin-like [Ruditapes philippinarum]